MRLGDDPQANRIAKRARNATSEATTTIEGLTHRALAALLLRATTLKEWTRLAKAEILPAPLGK